MTNVDEPKAEEFGSANLTRFPSADYRHLGQPGGESTMLAETERSAVTLEEDVYTVRQVGTGRLLDAYETLGDDFAAVTRDPGHSRSQHWRFTPVGLVCTIGQHSTNRTLEAHDHPGNDYSAVTRVATAEDDQRWVAMSVPGSLSTYTLQQLSTGRFLDAHGGAEADFSVMTRRRVVTDTPDDDTQRWRLAPLQIGSYTIAQVATGRCLDAHRDAPNDFSAMTRPRCQNVTAGADGQRWTLTTIGAVYEIEQVSSGRKLDAHDSQVKDFSAMTRNTGSDDCRRWVGIYRGDRSYTLQQLSSGRYLDAHQSATSDFAAVTRTRQDAPTQQWAIT